MVELPYGPVGDPNSKDMFERAQAVAPVGWHIEGQINNLVPGWRAQATTKKGGGWTCTGWGRTPDEAMSALLRHLADLPS